MRSHSRYTSLAPTFMNYSRLIFCISSSRVHLKIIWSIGLQTTSIPVRRLGKRRSPYLMRLTVGRSVDNIFMILSTERCSPFRVAAACPFPGLRRFPHGRNYSQWTGDDSKALMKVRYSTSWSPRVVCLLRSVRLSGLSRSNCRSSAR